MNKSLLSILIISSLYSDSITVYSSQSAQYISTSSASCCTPTSLQNFNAPSMYVQGCWWHTVYEQCLENKYTAIWRFDLSEVPENAFLSNLNFLFNQAGVYGNSVKVTTEIGDISDGLASNLYSDPIWTDYINNDGNLSNHNISIPIEQITSDDNLIQLNILLSNDGYSITNIGNNAPRLVIEYEIQNIILLGDINGDSIVNVLDLMAIVNTIFNSSNNYIEIADMNYDGIIDIFDLIHMVEVI